MTRSARRPHCFLNVAVSLDGKVASVARELPSFPSAEDRRVMDQIRARSDAILVGGGTLRAADFPLRIRSRALQVRRLASGRPEQPLNVLLSASLRVPLTGRFFSARDVKRLVVTSSAAPKRLRERIRGSAEVLAWKGRWVNLRRLMSELHRRGVRQLLLEGGGATNFEFFRQGLVDEIYMTLCPLIIGGAGSPTPVDGAGFPPELFQRYLLVAMKRVRSEIYLHYRRD